ncbi:MAG: acyl-phosphate glycerol 3-phosphate acyltransferase [Alphaproteobacteria bacterium]|nr:acyl-phosphate glycerol 3-phosphate acyltransferase [Alphaproteobacteria bacterium]HCP01242.1 acyl-phosphate glycerol 3-phosphate acyltransferase [Rhodospirillaceae bacterium]
MVEDGASSIIFYWSIFQTTFSIPDWKNVVYGWQVFLPPIIGAYLLGSIPFGLILTKLAGKGNLRQIGSGNIGATNVLRTGSKKLAATTLLLDCAKGYGAVHIPYLLFGPDITFFTALAVVLGHLFPVWLQFRGGKGVATALGVLLGLTWPLGVAVLTTWLIVALIFRYSSLSALVAMALAPFYAWWLGEPQPSGIAMFLAVLVWIRHVNNVRRLLRGEESRISLNSSRKAS